MSTHTDEHCLHCEIAKLCEAQFPSLTIEGSIHAMLELIADFISGEPLEEQMRLFELAEQMMMTNRNAVLRGTYKGGGAAA